MNAYRLSLLLGALSLALIAGALAFQYIGHIPPCEICHWQRWPHIAAAIVGLGGGALVAGGLLDAKWAPVVAALTIVLIAVAGGLGVYHAGVEWKWWAGPPACTGERFEFTGLQGINEHAVRCDEAAWRLFGISLAGYNALFSLGAAAWGALTLRRP
jgi:disulfide bond formation protein DsbB